MGHDTYCGLFSFSAHKARACVLNARACVHSLIFERILSKFSGDILRLTISDKDYVLFMFTHRALVCERACSRVRVIKRLLIYGRVLFKFAVHILQITTSSIYGQHTLHVRALRACVRAQVCEHARG
jgi:hypothetical protein